MDSDPLPRSEVDALEANVVAPPIRQPSREEKLPPLPDVTSRPVLIDSDLHQHQSRRLAKLELQVKTLMEEIKSCRGIAQDAHDEGRHQQSATANLASRLDMAERFLKTAMASQRDEAKYTSFVVAVEHALFHPQGKVGTLQAQVKSLQNRFDSEGSIKCHGVHFASKTEMAAWFQKNGLTIGIF